MGGAVASAFCFGGGEQILACPPLLARAGGMWAHGSAVARSATLVGVLASGGGLGAGLHLHLWLGQLSPWGPSDYFNASVAPGP